jgi:hypothetical protein
MYPCVCVRMFSALVLCQCDAPTIRLLDISSQIQYHCCVLQGAFLAEWDGLSTSNAAPVVVLGATNRPMDLDKGTALFSDLAYFMLYSHRTLFLLSLLPTLTTILLSSPLTHIPLTSPLRIPTLLPPSHPHTHLPLTPPSLSRSAFLRRMPVSIKMVAPDQAGRRDILAKMLSKEKFDDDVDLGTCMD